MSIGVSVRTIKFAARNNSFGVRQESNPQSPTAYSFETLCIIMERQKIIYLLILIFGMTGCKSHLLRSKKYWDTEKQKMEICRKSWKFMDLTEKIELKVLLFNKKRQFDLSVFPNFVIGVTANSDTIGIIDKDFSGIINRNEKTTVSPAMWTEEEMQLYVPSFSVYPNSNDNDLHCSVKKIFRGQINKE